jgi:hypothetical protein
MTTTQSQWITTAAIPAPPGCVVAIRDRNGNRSVHTGAALLVQHLYVIDSVTRVVVGVLDHRGHVVPAMELGEVVHASPGLEGTDIGAFL